MLFANDCNDKRVYIDETHSDQEYYCPYCGAPLITKIGDVRQHHFAHKSSRFCSDSWESSYDISDWHKEWQSLFPKENQEIKLTLGSVSHRADVMIDKTVIEFQHSIMSVKNFEDRNNFYNNLSNKVVWLFDLTNLYDEEQLSYKENENGLIFEWKNPKRAFNSYDVQSGAIDLFFQLEDKGENCIVRVLEVSENGFESFKTSGFLNKTEFLEYLGVKDGKCLPPCLENPENNEQYLAFKKKYKIQLNPQQERALLAVEGSVLLLAVPGSGKTTVLVNRLGHMIINKNIPPENILAITFNKNACEDMKKRFSSVYGYELGERITFKTIHSLSYDIYKSFCQKSELVEKREMLEDNEQKKIVRDIYRNFNKDKDQYPSEEDISNLKTYFTYIKNMMFSNKEILQLEIESKISKISQMYEAYENEKKESNKMDFDDQLDFAYKILKKHNDVLDQYKSKYRYICVDEAQDTSKIQHEIIRLLADGNNIFMVGDEDQSIYGFRGAYPKALLNFRYDYKNPYILCMERNYRSTSQITEKAKSFISKNKGRYEKNMISERGVGEEVIIEDVYSREQQYERLIEIAKETNREIAFLYRNNESAVVLVDLLLKNNITYKHRKPEMAFFETGIVKDIVAYLSLAINNRDIKSFEQICNKGIIYLKYLQKDYAIANCRDEKITIYEAVEGQIPYLKKEYKDRGKLFKNVMESVANATPEQAIQILLDKGYGKYLKENNLNIEKIDILKILAKQEPNIESFLNRLEYLEKEFKKGGSSYGKVTLSTIHSSKGLEYDSVYMVDVYDDHFPASRHNIISQSKDNADGEQEERRLFYVGMTRAKNELYFFNIRNNKKSSFIEELFPNKFRRQEYYYSVRPRHFDDDISDDEQLKRDIIEAYRREVERKKLLEEEKAHKELKLWQEGYNEVKDKFTQQDTKIIDSRGKRWVKCERCGAIKRENEFVSYGGPNRNNLGVCRDCTNENS